MFITEDIVKKNKVRGEKISNPIYNKSKELHTNEEKPITQVKPVDPLIVYEVLIPDRIAFCGKLKKEPGTSDDFNFKLTIKKLINKANPYFRGLKFTKNNTKFVFRYPYRYDNEAFIFRLSRFIENDIIKNPYENMKNNKFCVDIIEGKLEIVDKPVFDEKEKQFFKSTNIIDSNTYNEYENNENYAGLVKQEES